MSKNYPFVSALENSHLTQDCRCPNDLLYKVKDLPLRRQRGIQLLNGTKKKSVTEEGFGPFDPRFRKTMLYPTELLSLIWGERRLTNRHRPKVSTAVDKTQITNN